VLLLKYSEQYYRNVINFLYKGEFCVRLHDKICYLEVQIRHYKYCQLESMYPVFSSLYYSLDKICKSEQLEFGFICHHAVNRRDHMMVVSSIRDPESCSLEAVEKVLCGQCQQQTEIGKLHRMWFDSTGQYVYICHVCYYK